MSAEKLKEKIESGRGITHPATFHADDVLSTCLLKIINPDIKIDRTNIIPDKFDGVIYDIGMGEYDHHQENSKRRDNGIKYAAFGLLWKDIYSLFMDEEHAYVFDAAFISEIDRCDNGPDTNLLTSSIDFFNPTWNSEEDETEQFNKAVEICKPMLESLIYHFQRSTFIPRYCQDLDECIKIAFQNIYYKKYNKKLFIPIYNDMKETWEKEYYKFTPNESADFFYKTFLAQTNRTYGKYKTSPFVLAMSCMRKKDRINMIEKIIERRFFSINSLYPARVYCEEVYQKSKRKDIIVFDKYVPYDSLSEKHESVKAVVFPTNRNGYTMMCVNLNSEEKQKKGIIGKGVYKRLTIPSDLRGKSEEYLREKFNGLFFVHPSGYMAVCDEINNVIDFYEKIVN